MKKQKVTIKKYDYCCDGGSIAITNSKGATIQLHNQTGDGDYHFYVLKAPGWGPAMYSSKKEYEKYESFLKGWRETRLILWSNEEDGYWYVQYYDGCTEIKPHQFGVLWCEPVCLGKSYVRVYTKGDDFLFVCYQDD